MTEIFSWRWCIGGFVNMMIFIVSIIVLTILSPLLFAQGLGWAIIYIIIIWIILQSLGIFMTWMLTRGLEDGGRRRA